MYTFGKSAADKSMPLVYLEVFNVVRPSATHVAATPNDLHRHAFVQLDILINFGIIISGGFTNTEYLPGNLSRDASLQSDSTSAGDRLKRILYVSVLTAIVAIFLGNFWVHYGVNWRSRLVLRAAGVSAFAAMIVQFAAFGQILTDIRDAGTFCDGLNARCAVAGCDATAWDSARFACGRFPTSTRGAAALSFVSAVAQLVLGCTAVYMSYYASEDVMPPVVTLPAVPEPLPLHQETARHDEAVKSDAAARAPSAASATAYKVEDGAASATSPGSAGV